MTNSSIDIDSLRSALPAGMDTKEIIFIPINDGDDDYVEGGNGSHWSLLVYSNRPHPGFHYYDSAASSNYNYAVGVKRKLELFMCGSAQSELPMVTHSCPQQDNGTDCGIFVIMFADLLARRHANSRMLLSSQALSPSLLPLPSQLPLLPLLPYLDRENYVDIGTST
ncbi:SUMO1 sentrin specific peptidase 8 [Kickxella alabastrina]|nr:SUMO1 sentrin specific peptidase 8 [Kickxella alabastrina]